MLGMSMVRRCYKAGIKVDSSTNSSRRNDKQNVKWNHTLVQMWYVFNMNYIQKSIIFVVDFLLQLNELEIFKV